MQLQNHQLSPKQGSLLFKATGRKFWEPTNLPPPTVKEASEIISLIMNAIGSESTLSEPEKATSLEEAACRIRAWFPEFERHEIRWRFFGGHKEDKPQPEPSTAPEPQKARKTREQPGAEATKKAKTPGEAEHKGQAKPEPKAEPKPEPKAEAAKPEAKPMAQTSDALSNLVALNNAGIRNIWLHGPAGCGKTTVCKIAGDLLGLPVTVLSCNAGTSPGEFTGFRFPTATASAITEAITMAGIVVLDEFTMLQPDVAAVANALLANGEINTVLGLRVRHPDCVIVATANTVGQGADRQYIGNNQLDAATLDRFVCGFVEVDYSTEWEASNGDEEVCNYCWKLRLIVRTRNLRRIVSTRSIQAGTLLKKAGMDWKAAIIATWTSDERSMIV